MIRITVDMFPQPEMKLLIPQSEEKLAETQELPIILPVKHRIPLLARLKHWWFNLKQMLWYTESSDTHNFSMSKKQ
jgi:hypothetical protein